MLILGAAGVDEFDEIYDALDDEIIDEIFDEANIDDPDALVSAISAALNGNFSWCDIFDKIGDCGFEFDTAKIETLIAKIKNSGCDIDVGDLIAGLVDKDFDIDAIKNILADLKIDIGGDCDISAIITELIGNCDCIEKVIDFLTGLGGKFDIKAVFEWLLSLKGDTGCEWSTLIEWLKTVMGQFNFDFSTLYQWIEKFKALFGKFEFDAFIKWLISMIAGVIDPSKDPSITDPSTPLDPGVTIPNDPTALSPTTGDESSMLINLALLALALLSAGGLALLLRNKKTAAVEMVETAASTDRESTDSVASLRAFGGRRKAR